MGNNVPVYVKLTDSGLYSFGTVTVVPGDRRKDAMVEIGRARSFDDAQNALLASGFSCPAPNRRQAPTPIVADLNSAAA